jgi:hypothetical protein
MGRGDDAVYTGFYAPHLSGTRRDIMMRRSPSREREGLIERMYMRVLTEMCVNRFKWEGLPDSVDVRFMELTLFRFALSVFYHDNDFNKYLALQGAPSGRMDYAQNPLAFTINGNSRFVSKTLPARQLVPIWANYLRIPDYDVVTIYAQKLAELDRTIEINSKNARRPKVLVTNENGRLSGVNIVRQFDEGNPLIQVNTDGAFGALTENVTALDLGIDPDSIEKLHILRTRLWGECMGLLGIDFANQDKKERLVAAEVDANGDQVENMRRVNLNARQMACDMINAKYPELNVSVSYWVSNIGMQTQTDIMADENSGDMG